MDIPEIEIRKIAKELRESKQMMNPNTAEKREAFERSLYLMVSWVNELDPKFSRMFWNEYDTRRVT